MQGLIARFCIKAIEWGRMCMLTAVLHHHSGDTLARRETRRVWKGTACPGFHVSELRRLRGEVSWSLVCMQVLEGFDLVKQLQYLEVDFFSRPKERLKVADCGVLA